VCYSGVYPGVDLVYFGTQGRLEYDFTVAPGASAAPIRLAFDGAEHLSVDARGNLKIKTDDREIAFQRPVAYQLNSDGRRTRVVARYRLAGNKVHFQVGAYDHAKQLTIDPVLSYFSHLAKVLFSWRIRCLNWAFALDHDKGPRTAWQRGN
jgi:hypothetical protein